MYDEAVLVVYETAICYTGFRGVLSSHDKRGARMRGEERRSRELSKTKAINSSAAPTAG